MLQAIDELKEIAIQYRNLVLSADALGTTYTWHEDAEKLLKRVTQADIEAIQDTSEDTAGREKE